MALSNEQIERYSRQIILHQVGGRGQERLLAARIAMVGDLADLESSLAYLVGAGVGTVRLIATGDTARQGNLIDQMRELNPEVKVGTTATASPDCDLVLILIGGESARDAAAAANSESRATPLIAARLDRPGEIVIVPGRPPCIACAGDTLAAFGIRSDAAELVKMVATTEALKYLVNPSAEGAIISFEGLSSVASELRGGRDCTVCTNSSPREKQM